MAKPKTTTRLVIIEMWKEERTAGSFRARIIDRAELPALARRGIPVGDIGSLLTEIETIIDHFVREDPSSRSPMRI